VRETNKEINNQNVMSTATFSPPVIHSLVEPYSAVVTPLPPTTSRRLAVGKFAYHMLTMRQHVRCAEGESTEIFMKM